MSLCKKKIWKKSCAVAKRSGSLSSTDLGLITSRDFFHHQPINLSIYASNHILFSISCITSSKISISTGTLTSQYTAS